MTRTPNIESEAAAWLARQDGDNWTDARDHELNAWLDADTAHTVAYLRLRAAWDRADRLGALKGPGPYSRTRFSWSAPPWGRLALAAACVALIALVGGLAITIGQKMAPRTYATAIGGRQNVTLADGSTLLLNTDTRIRANVTRRGGRLVRLDQGEAFFDIKHDAEHPFVVIAGDRQITDLGTKFSVWRDGDKVRVVVEEGRVRIDKASAPTLFAAAPAPANIAESPAIVTRGGVAVANAQTVLVVHQDDNQLARDLSWRHGVLSFNQTTLGEAAAEFNRYNEKKLIIEASAAKIRIDGAFRADNVDSFASLLRQGFGLKIDDSGDQINISN